MWFLLSRMPVPRLSSTPIPWQSTIQQSTITTELLHCWDHACIFTMLCFSTSFLQSTSLFTNVWDLPSLCLELVPLLTLPLNPILCFYIASFLCLNLSESGTSTPTSKGKLDSVTRGLEFTTGASVSDLCQANHTVNFKFFSVTEFMRFIFNIVTSNSVKLCVTVTVMIMKSFTYWPLTRIKFSILIKC